MANTNRVSELIEQLRGQCLKRGVGGIKELSVAFRRMDQDYSKRLCFQELEEGIKNFGLNVTNEELHLVFDEFDKDKNKQIDFLELVATLRPPMPTARIEVVNEAFNKLDANGDGDLKLEDLKSKLVDTFRVYQFPVLWNSRVEHINAFKGTCITRYLS